jgi:hypothetical protein
MRKLQNIEEKIRNIEEELQEIYETERKQNARMIQLMNEKRLLLIHKNRGFENIILKNIDVLISMSEHNRTSCCDTNNINCGGDFPCPRCQLIEAKNNVQWDTSYTLNIAIERTKDD